MPRQPDSATPWAPRLGFEQCKLCGTIEIPHHAFGLCGTCYSRTKSYPRIKADAERLARERARWRRAGRQKTVDPEKRRRYNREYYRRHREGILDKAKARPTKKGGHQR